MHIGVVGGLERVESVLQTMGALAGHQVEFHRGHVQGGSQSLAALVDRCDMVIIVTDVNSHGAVQLTKRLCRRRGQTPLVVRNCGPARFERILEAIETRDATAQGAGASC